MGYILSEHDLPPPVENPKVFGLGRAALWVHKGPGPARNAIMEGEHVTALLSLMSDLYNLLTIGELVKLTF